MSADPAPGSDPAGRALALECEALARSLDGNLWKRAELVADAKAAKTRQWARIAGISFNRKPGRVREWASLAAWVSGLPLPNPSEIRYSALEVLYRFRKRVAPADLLEMFDTWQAERNLPVDTLAGQLTALCGAGAKADDPARLIEQATALLTRAVAAGDVDGRAARMLGAVADA